MAAEWWVAPLHSAIYPPEARRRKPSLAKQCPKFGMDSVLLRPDGDPADDTNVRPGAHGFGQGDTAYSVVWWDPRVLELGKTPSFSLRQEHLLKEVDSEVIERDLQNYAAWRDQHRATLEEGRQPSLQVLTASERARTKLDLETGDVKVVEIGVAARPFGPRFGSLVHVILASIPLDSSTEQIRASAELNGRIFGAPAEEVEAAVKAVASALQHPLMERARQAASCGACYRELPVTLREEDGTLVEGLADLAFRENGKWVVVDFKTDQELAGVLERYRRQVAIYATAISKATASSCDSFLFRV
jgi:ATP-dependent exoDNAse (exonuclease V) beta subunit